MPEFANPNLNEPYATGTNALLTVTLAAPGSTNRWRIKTLLASVSGGSAILTVTSGSTEIFAQAVTPGAPFFGYTIDIESLAANDAITVTLSAAGASNIGYLFVAGEVT
jgi:hypothetical protein